MRRLLIALASVLLSAHVWAETCTWSANGKWSNGGGCTPTADDTCTINSNIIVVCDQSPCLCGQVTNSGHVYTTPTSTGFKIGDGLAAGTTDHWTNNAGASLIWGPGQTVEFNTTSNAGTATTAGITNNGYISATGRIITEGIVGSFTRVTGAWPNRVQSIHDRRSRQTVIDEYDGLILVPITGYHRWQWFDITTGAATTGEIVIRADSRGAYDSRGKAGRVNPASTTWAPGSKGTTYSVGTATTNGTTTVNFGGGASIIPSNALGSRFICTAGTDDDSEEAFDANHRIICAVNSTTQVTLCTAYPNSSCTGGTYVIYDDNQPAVAAPVVDSFAVGDRYLIVEPAILTATNKSDVNMNGHWTLTANSGSTTSFSGVEIGYCGQRKGGGAASLDCMTVNQIDNSLATEQFVLDLSDVHHPSGQGVLTANDGRFIKPTRTTIRDCAEGGADDGGECHGVQFYDPAGGGRSEFNGYEDGRVVRLNDDAFSWFANGESDGNVCANCAIRRTVFGWLGVNTIVDPSAQGFETGSGETVTNLVVDECFVTNTDSNSFAFPDTNPAHVTSAAITNSIIQNSQTGGLMNAASGETAAPTDANFRVVFVGNLFRNGAASEAFTVRGRYFSNIFDGAQAGSRPTMSYFQAARGNILIGPPAAPAGTLLMLHQPTDDNLTPAVVRIYDNVLIGNRDHTDGNGIRYAWLGVDIAAAAAVGYDVQHNSIFGVNDTEGAFEIAGIIMQGPVGRTNTIKNNLFGNLYDAISASGAQTNTSDYNLFWRVTAPGVTLGANDLTTGIIGIQNPSSLWPDFDLLPGATAKTALGDDGTPRGVRVAGPSFHKLRGVYSFLAQTPSVNNTGSPIVDQDGDGIYDLHDNCALTVNVFQTDTDGDGKGDECDATP